MKKRFISLMVLVIMLISIGGCCWWGWDRDGHGRGGERGGGESHGGGEGRGGGGEHGGRH